jgi:N-acetylglutamate synthase-like GNAT family acetyltransferase
MRIDYLPDDIRIVRQVAAWLYGEWGHLSPGSTLDNAMLRLSLQGRARTLPLVLVAFEDCRPVGTASLVYYDMKSRQDLTPWLASVWVLPAYRRQGVATALCQRARAEARRLRLGRVYLFTRDKMSFYDTLGWKRMRQVELRSGSYVIMHSS